MSAFIDTELSEAMRLVRQACKLGLSARATIPGLKVRQPCAEIVVVLKDQGLMDRVTGLREEIRDEVNAKVAWIDFGPPGGIGWIHKGDSDMDVYLQTILTWSLLLEGAAREVVRHGQVTRKSMGLAISNRVVATLFGPEPLDNTLIADELQATSLSWSTNAGSDVKTAIGVYQLSISRGAFDEQV